MTTTQHTAGPWRVFDAFTDPEIVTDRPTAFETETDLAFRLAPAMRRPVLATPMARTARRLRIGPTACRARSTLSGEFGCRTKTNPISSNCSGSLRTMSRREFGRTGGV